MHGTTLRIETLTDHRLLSGIVEEWRELAAAAGEPNIFMEPMAVLPALGMPSAKGMFAALAWGADAAGRRQLVGMLLLKRWSRAKLLPAGLECWDYRLRAFGEPLIRAGREHAFWTAMLPYLDDLRGAAFLRLAQLHENSASTHALRAVAAEMGRPHYVTRRLDRALLRGPASAEEYLKTLSSKMLRELKRRRKRLEEIGPLSFERLAPDASEAPWIDEFIALEASGWKGRRGVAAASEPEVEVFTRQLMREAHRQGRLDMRRVRLGERTISMLAHIESGRTAVSFKIAYDEEFARVSPGVLLQLEYLPHGLGLDWVDSCTSPGHPMFERIWTERRPICSLMVPLDRPVARLTCAIENAGRDMVRRLTPRLQAARAALR